MSSADPDIDARKSDDTASIESSFRAKAAASITFAQLGGLRIHNNN